MLGLTLALTGCRSGEDIKADAAPVIEQIFSNLGIDVDCQNIYDVQRIDSDHYTAKAEVSDGEDTAILNIKITYDNDIVIVEIVD